MSTTGKMCAHESCRCAIEPSGAVAFEGQSYCSQRCADDRGCDHAGCNCGVFPTAEPDPTRVGQGGKSSPASR